MTLEIAGARGHKSAMVGKASGWLKSRGCGILLHPSSLPGNQGIGVVGEEALELVEFLRDAEMLYWQTLPLEPTGYGHSPYQSISCFAGEPLLIDLKALMAFGLIQPEELAPLAGLPATRVDFDALERIKKPLLRLAWRRFEEKGLAYIPNYGLLEEFLDQESEWIEDYAAYAAFKDHFGQSAWMEWPAGIRDRDPAALRRLSADLADEIALYRFLQYLFFGQWDLIRRQCRECGIELISDLHLYPAMDSADVWAHVSFFLRDRGGQRFAMPVLAETPEGRAIIQPDRVVCNWSTLEQMQFEPWIRHVRGSLRKYDIVRLLNFDGYTCTRTVDFPDSVRSKEVPFNPENLFDRLFRELPHVRFIADDSGVMAPTAVKLQADLRAPGTAVLIEAFDGVGDHRYLPHNLERNHVLYTSTHDTSTVTGWYESAGLEEQDQARRYHRVSGEDIAWDFIRSAYRSPARLVLIPVQDLLGLDNRARMVIPGMPEQNWRWRLDPAQFELMQGSANYLRELSWLYSR